ncbi:hypothetical protein C8Q74DRAFT_263170 [Fomes fomentarius]|nr:hypothetical protein C8Q74DRAFT_263170 [Fomes fomentarius]
MHLSSGGIDCHGRLLGKAQLYAHIDLNSWCNLSSLTRWPISSHDGTGSITTEDRSMRTALRHRLRLSVTSLELRLQKAYYHRRSSTLTCNPASVHARHPGGEISQDSELSGLNRRGAEMPRISTVSERQLTLRQFGSALLYAIPAYVFEKRHPNTMAQLSMSMAVFIGLLCEAVLYGTYTVLVGGALYLSMRKPRQRRFAPTNILMIMITVLMYGM